MENKVNRQAEIFQLSFGSGEWRASVGHRLKIGGYEFSAVPQFTLGFIEMITVSEVESGVRLAEFTGENAEEQTKEEAMAFLENEIIPEMEKALEKFGWARFGAELIIYKAKALELCGPQPEIVPAFTDGFADG